jgi:hypothetical protein
MEICRRAFVRRTSSPSIAKLDGLEVRRTGKNSSAARLNSGYNDMRDFRMWLAIGGLLLAGRLLYPVLAGERSSQVRDEYRQLFVFVCRESGETFVMRAKNAVETHPRTGQPTLMPGLYCEQCQKWRASPSLSLLQQNPSASLCPTHKTLMTNNGPLPSEGK